MQEMEVDVDGIQRRLGTGRFQILSFFVLGLIYSRGAWHVFGIMFLAGDPGHKCAFPHDSESGLLSLSSSPSSSSSPLFDTDSSNLISDDTSRSPASVLPPHQDPNSSSLYSSPGETGVSMVPVNWTADSCTVSYVDRNGSQVRLISGCPYGWSYGSLFESTVLSEWDLVCGRNFLVELSITIFMGGATLGAMVILPLADRFGRKRVMMGCLLSQACVGTATSFVHSYIVFTVLRFILGMLNIGVGLSCFVFMTETFPADKRTVMSIAFQVFWAAGVMTVAGFGYLLRNWRHLQLVLSLPNLLTLPCWWMLPESLPWLISQKRWAEVTAAISTIARVNRKDAKQFSPLLPTHNRSSTTPNPHHSRNTSTHTHTPSSTNQNTADKICNTDVVESETDAMIETECHHNGKTLKGDGAHSVNKIGTKVLTNGSAIQIGNEILTDNCDNNIRTEASTNGYGDQIGTEISTDHGVDDMRTKMCGGDGGKAEGTGHLGDHIEGHMNGKCRQGEGEGEETLRQTSNSILDLFRNRQMRLYSCIMFFLFFVNSLGYFGISFSVPALHGNQFVNLCIMGLVEIPANAICVLIGQRVGRRYPSAMFLLLCGVSNIIAIFSPSHVALVKLGFVMLGKFAITAAYSTIYLYSAEIFPTDIRNQAMGMSSVFENIGSISAPFIVLAAKSIPELPLAVFGALTVGGACLTLLLPETHNRPLPQTVHEITTW